MVAMPQLDFRLFLKAYHIAQLFVYVCCFNGVPLYLCRERQKTFVVNTNKGLQE